MNSQPHKYYPDELVFLKKNFYKLTNDQLLEQINSNRTRKVSMSAMLHKCRKMGLSKGIQIRWSDADVKYIIKHYQTKGNYELAMLLNKRRKTFRVIDGKKVYRKFTKKHVEKKLGLLGLSRTNDEVHRILKRNIEIGIRPVFSKEDNLYTRGIKPVAGEYDIKVWNANGYTRRVIKVDGKFIPYARWFYHNYIGSVPDGWNVYHKDMDPLNDDPGNLYIHPMSSNAYGDYIIAKKLLNERINRHYKIKRQTRHEEREWQSELRRLRNILNKVNAHIERVLNNSKKYGSKVLREPRFSPALPNGSEQQRVVLAKKNTTPLLKGA
ncbi:MAG: hypothetical protein ACOC10_07220 [Bacteroidota bacterium]